MLSMTFGTVGKARSRSDFSPMEPIATITLIAAATCGFALVGLLWRAAERADEAVETLVQRRHITG